MKHTRVAIAAGAAIAAVLATAPAAAQDAGRYLAGNCANCHGTDGVSAGGIPSLAGLPKAGMVAQLMEFKAGKRPATIMHQLAKGYTDQQIDTLADFYSKLPRK